MNTAGDLVTSLQAFCAINGGTVMSPLPSCSPTECTRADTATSQLQQSSLQTTLSKTQSHKDLDKVLSSTETPACAFTEHFSSLPFAFSCP